MKITPKRNQVLGRIVDLTKSKGGIVLPDNETKGVTTFVLLDAVGPGADAAVGDIVLPRQINHIYLRGAEDHRVIFDDTQILATISDISLDQFTIEGEPARAVLDREYAARIREHELAAGAQA